MQPDAGGTTATPIAAPIASQVPTCLGRVIRYGCVGLVISLLYSLAVIACVQALHPISPVVASAVAFIIVLPPAYLAHRRVSFSDRGFDTFQPLRFALSTTASFVVAVGGMFWITEIAGRSYLFAIALNWLIIPAMNFLTYLLWVFRAARNTGGTA